jgi:hypothetical protein
MRQPNPAFQQENEFVRQAKQQAAALGLCPEVIQNRYTMRIELIWPFAFGKG